MENDSSHSTERPIVDSDHPWLGLYPYTEDTQAYFFGRNAEIREMFTRVRENPLTILFGQSGLGKSSLLAAGLIPKLKVEHYRPVLLRLDFSENSSSPVEQTRLALLQSIKMNTPNPKDSLWEILHCIPNQPGNLRENPPVLIFDQFEEIFTKISSKSIEVNKWFTQIADLVENRPPYDLQKKFRQDRQLSRQFDILPTPARIVIALREDYLSHLEGWKDKLPSLMRNRMALHLLNGPQALEATIFPGLRGPHSIVPEEVGKQIVRKVARRPESFPIEDIEAVPPFLSLLCEQLNAARLIAKPPMPKITTELVTSQGDDILDIYYEDSFHGQPEALRSFIEDRLVDGSGHRNQAAREEAIRELQDSGVADPAKAIDTLISRRLITEEYRGKIRWLELTHDVLTPLVVRSKTTRKEQQALLEYKRQKIRQRIIAVSLTTVALVFAGLSLFSWSSYQRAEKAKNEINLALAKADNTLIRVKWLQEKLENELVNSQKQAKELEIALQESEMMEKALDNLNKKFIANRFNAYVENNRIPLENLSGFPDNILDNFNKKNIPLDIDGKNKNRL